MAQGAQGGAKMRSKLLKAIVIAMILLGSVSTGLRAAEQPGAMEKKALFRRGVHLWPAYCGYCHKARPGADFSPVQWDTIMMHMRVRANLPAGDARAILEFLRSR